MKRRSLIFLLLVPAALLAAGSYQYSTPAWRLVVSGVERLTVLPGGQFGVGTITPDAALHVVGSVKLATGATNGYVLTSDPNGVATWQAAPGGGAPGGAAGGDLAGTYPNPTVADLTIASEAQGDLLYRNASNWVRLAAGTAGYVLTTAGAGANPAWAAAATPYTDEQAQDATGGMLDGSLTYVDGTPLLQRAALTGDVTASAGSNATTVAKINGVAYSADPLAQYVLLAGRSGGQTLIGGTASGNSLTLQSTSHATRGKLLFGTSGYDEVNNRLGVGTASPGSTLDVNGVVAIGIGAVGAPGLAFRGDLDNGIYTPTGDAMSFVNGGVERMRLSGAQLGIGTITPSSGIPLYVKTTGFGVATLESTNSTAEVRFINSNNGNGFLQYNGTDWVIYANSGGAPSLYILGGAPGNLAVPGGVRIGAATAPGAKLDITGDMATRATSPAQITANTNDLSTCAATAYCRLSTDASRTVTGLTGGMDGKRLVIANVGAFDLVLANQSTSSAAGNRLITGSGADITVPADSAAAFIYDANSTRWRRINL